MSVEVLLSYLNTINCQVLGLSSQVTWFRGRGFICCGIFEVWVDKYISCVFPFNSWTLVNCRCGGLDISIHDVEICLRIVSSELTFNPPMKYTQLRFILEKYSHIHKIQVHNNDIIVTYADTCKMVPLHLTENVISSTKIKVPLTYIEQFMDYYSEVFPIFKPTPRDMSIKLHAHLMRRNPRKWIYRDGIRLNISQTNNCSQYINELEQDFGVTFELMEIKHNSMDQYFEILNVEHIYTTLWEREILNPMIRQKFKSFTELLLPEIRSLIGEYISN